MMARSKRRHRGLQCGCAQARVDFWEEKKSKRKLARFWLRLIFAKDWARKKHLPEVLIVAIREPHY
jgi:hypothetical protein